VATFTTFPEIDLYPGFATFPGSWSSTPTQLFTPPQRRQVNFLEGSLRVSFLVNSTVWKDQGGAWHAQENPYDGDLATAQVIFTEPAEVDDATAAELIAAGIGTVTEE